MPTDLILPLCLVSGLLLWTLIFRWYVDPMSRHLDPISVMRPILLLHSFRYIGLLFLVPGVTRVPLDDRFAIPAAYGDLIAAGLALTALFVLSWHRSNGLVLTWVFNVFGTADLLNAIAMGLAYTDDGDLGATFWIPAAIVPLLLVTHGYLFLLLVRMARRSPPQQIAAP